MNKKKRVTPLLIGVSAFSISMIFLWATHVGEIDKMIMIVGMIYGSTCFMFLLFQIVAFVRSHVVYDEDVESIKMKVFDAEELV
jgi:hypothetical protein